ncbi:hypothetical protein FJTKL_06278 [Diaporthe vaccinii]|uniref:SH3 domain-containing protein n=1 Tax=Diaporthe vaccinii TaxID=105482 RepID=A0ABR4DTW2_9PEZI
MNKTVDDLVLAPFGDIVAHGKVAISNAEDSGDGEMLRAAQILVKEGERALKKVEPVCRKGCVEYGPRFVDALMENGPISELTEELSDLLYDFEDYVEADKFDARRFSELHALSRKAAPRILHIITRMKLASSQFEDSTTSPATEIISPYAESSLPYPEGPEADGQIHDALRHVAKLDRTLEKAPAEAFAVLPYPDEEYAPPPPPIRGPWPRTFHAAKEGVDWRTQRRGTTASAPGSAPVSHIYPERNLSPSSGNNGLSFPSVPPRSPARLSNTQYSNGRLGPQPDYAAASARYREKGSIPAAPTRLSARASIGSSTVVSSQSSFSDHHRERQSHVGIVSPVSTVDRDSVSSERHGQSLQVPPLFARSAAESPGYPVGSSVNLVANSVQDVPDGLIPVDDETTEYAPPLRPPPPIPEDCSITLNSSFYHFKGFCQGSMEIVQGGLGVRRIKKQGLSGGFKEVAKCKSCPFELEWAAVERDLNDEPSENFKSAGIGFRLRFLSKSHLPATHVGDQVYGCLFCVQLGRTTHPNDATVFFSQKQIFNHLARHPRPLPHVPGLTVVETADLGPYGNKYDLHFFNVPLKSHLATIMRDLAALPTATAVQTYKPTPTSSIRRPTDGQEVLNFASGAKILGVIFPDRYQGEWCLGW